MIAVFCAAGLLMTAGAAQANTLTFTFDPNDLLDLYPADYSMPNDTQPNARRIHEVYRSEYYATFSNNLLSGHSQPTDYDTYVNWRAGLGVNEGLGSFSFYLRGEYPTVTQAWGEILVTNPAVPITATAAPGWNATVVESGGPDGGEVVIWWTTDPALYIRPGGADIGTFTFTADLYEDSNWNGLDPTDPDATAGVPYRIWFADSWMNEGDWDVPALVYDDEGWGTLTPAADPFTQTVDGDSGVEIILTLTGVPEPATLCLLALGGVGLLLRRKR
jgi:hypothetical protein